MQCSWALFPLILLENSQSTKVQTNGRNPGTVPACRGPGPGERPSGALVSFPRLANSVLSCDIRPKQKPPSKRSAGKERHGPRSKGKRVVRTITVGARFSQTLPPRPCARAHTHTYMSTAQRSAKLFSHVMFPSQSFHSALFTPPLLPIEM